MPPLFCLKSSFGSGWVKYFILNVDPLLGLAYPENLSSIGLMVEAVDTFCGAGAVRCGCGCSAGAVPGVIIQKTSA